MIKSEVVAVGPDYIVRSEDHQYDMKAGDSTGITIDNVTKWQDHYTWFKFFIKIGWHILWHKRVRFTINQQPRSSEIKLPSPISRHF